MDLSIVIPVYNSERIVPELVRRIAQAMSEEYELILVNDGSADRSWQMIEQACDADPAVRGINLRINTGQHNAIMAGLRAASGAVVVVMDDDLQHAPEDIGKLRAKIGEGYDLCYAAFQRPQHALWKTAGSAFRDLTARALLGVPRGIRISSFKAMNADIAREITRYQGPFPYIDGLALTVTRSVANVELEHHPRLDGLGRHAGHHHDPLLQVRPVRRGDGEAPRADDHPHGHPPLSASWGPSCAGARARYRALRGTWPPSGARW